jgi:carboxymethylenebutenolidase
MRRRPRPELVVMTLLIPLLDHVATASVSRHVPADTTIVRLEAGDSTMDAFVAWPETRKNAPAVLVVHEGWGLDSQIRETARRLAREGYVAIVPDLYHGRVPADDDQARAFASDLQDATALADLEAAVRWLRAQPDLTKSRMGIAGFGMGGRLAERFAMGGHGLAAAVMFYGSPDVDPKTLSALRVPIQGHFGATDDVIPAQTVQDFREGLRASGREAEIHVYAGAGHSFMNDARPSFHPDAARQAWARTLAFLQKHLKG